MLIVPDRLSLSFSGDVACPQQQQEYDPGHSPYDAVPEYCSDGEDVLHQDQVMLPLAHDQHFRSHVARPPIQTLTFGMHETRDYAPPALYVADDAENADAFMVPNASPLSQTQAHAFDRTCPVCNARNVGNGEPVTPYPTQLGEDNGGSFIVPPLKPPLYDTPSPYIEDDVQTGVARCGMEYDHANPINLGTLRGNRGYPDLQSFCEWNEWSFPLSNVALPPFGHVPTGDVPAPARSPIVPNVVDDMTTNIGTKSHHLDCTAPQPGWEDNREWMDANYLASSYTSEPWHQERPRGAGTSTMSALLMDSLDITAFSGRQDGVQSELNHYPSQSCYPNVGSVPAQIIPPAIRDQISQVLSTYPPPSQGYLGLPGGDASAPDNSESTLATASFLPETSQAHPVPPHSTNSMTQLPPQLVPQSLGDLRPCPWKDNQGKICGKFVGRNCQRHLASAHGIVKISRRTLVRCGACDLWRMRSSFLRHFREKHLKFGRQR
ncbi:hypothetical protein EDC04DRAFT_444895 [Pisolithus marmoratus]|nr:hypothetical protein EDC04DRAFT_444895 [Pisolithus marmoratus]